MVIYKKMKTLECWRKTVLFVCVAALAIDPLFFLIPVVDSRRFCSTFDKKLGVAVCALRTLVDTFYVIHIISYFIMEVIAPRRSQPSWWGELAMPSNAIRIKHSLFDFIVDILSVLPVPQVVVLTLSTGKPRSTSLVTKQILKWIIVCQIVPRVVRIYPLFNEVTKDGTVAETRWIGAASNFFLYMLHSHVFGAFWYLGAIEKKDRCWREACAKTPGCNLAELFCTRGGLDNIRFLKNSCPLTDPGQITDSTVFNFGMYIDALKYGIVESRDFPRKFFHCFWWGLRNLSALGQNLETSNSVGEIVFALTICISGLLLFAVLIGNVQKYLQPLTIRVDEMKEKKKDTEKWMANRRLPEDLKMRIRKYENYKWRQTRGAEEETLLRSLPKDLRMATKGHLYMSYLKMVPPLRALDDRALDELCARLKRVTYTEKSCILREGDPLDEVLFIVRGTLISTAGFHGLFNSCHLKRRDFCGESLISWAAFQPHTSRVPVSNRTVRTLTDVEGLILSADDLKSVCTQYPNLYQSRDVRHIFRYYSAEWQTWGARFIQAAWRRHCRRKLLKALGEEEGKLHNNDDSGGNKLNLVATIYASRFASRALRSKEESSSSMQL